MTEVAIGIGIGATFLAAGLGYVGYSLYKNPDAAADAAAETARMKNKKFHDNLLTDEQKNLTGFEMNPLIGVPVTNTDNYSILLGGTTSRKSCRRSRKSCRRSSRKSRRRIAKK